MKKLVILLFLVLIVSSCKQNDESKDSQTITENELNSDNKLKQGGLPIQSIDDIDAYIQTMSIEEKAGQLIQAERGGISLKEIEQYNIGSILSGGGSVPGENTPKAWISMYNDMQESSRNSSSQLPIVYGIDAVHGNANVNNVTVFPHNIGLGAANDPVLMEKIGRATAIEIKATGVNWNFGPAVSCVQDIRWGRTYESYSEDIKRVAALAVPYIIGLQDEGVMATVKHFIGDGYTTFGTGEGDYLIDRGDVTVDMDELFNASLYAYEAAIEAGTNAIMASFNSIHGTKVHGDKAILTDLLRTELGFEGLVVSDWEAISTIAPDFNSQVALAVNAGVDLLMQPFNWKEVHNSLITNVEKGTISEERLNEAVKRNLVFKFKAGLFTEDYLKTPGEIGTVENRLVAREAVAKSLVLLKNNGVLPLKKDAKIYLMGPSADNVGYQCGGWTLSWQGESEADLYGGISVKDAFEKVLSSNGGTLVDSPKDADIIVVAIGETTYSEFMGDTSDLSLNGPMSLPGNDESVKEAVSYNKPVVTIMIAGRPLLVDDFIDDWDSFVMAWLPGTEGEGITDVLFGDKDFQGTLPVTWPLTNDQASDSMNMNGYLEMIHQFNYGDGLTYN